jgi:hypothetical protein
MQPGLVPTFSTACCCRAVANSRSVWPLYRPGLPSTQLAYAEPAGIAGTKRGRDSGSKQAAERFCGSLRTQTKPVASFCLRTLHRLEPLPYRADAIVKTATMRKCIPASQAGSRTASQFFVLVWRMRSSIDRRRVQQEVRQETIFRLGGGRPCRSGVHPDVCLHDSAMRVHAQHG